MLLHRLDSVDARGRVFSLSFFSIICISDCERVVCHANHCFLQKFYFSLLCGSGYFRFNVIISGLTCKMLILIHSTCTRLWTLIITVRSGEGNLTDLL